MPLSEPSTLYGRPTPAMSGCQSRSNLSIISQRGPKGPAGTACKGEAVRLTVSPQATPILLSPKSKARTIFGRQDSGIAADRADSRQFDSEQARGGVPSRLERQIKNQPKVHGRAQPGVRPDFVLQLAAVPTGVTQGDDGLIRTLAPGHGGQNVSRRRHVQHLGDLER